MKSKLLIIFVLIITSACFPLFFGGRVVGPYIRHYNGQMECAFIEGWYKQITCVCWMPNIFSDKTFLTPEADVFCKENADIT